jgi:thiol-disulfide isomerase/thioredoxin
MTSFRSLVLCTASLCLVSACGSALPSGSASTFAPSTRLAGQTLDGAQLSATTYRGHPVVVVFWAAWCGPCHDEQPRLNTAYRRWTPQGVRFVGDDMLDNDSAARAFVSQYSVPYPSIVDEHANIAAGFLVPAAPALVLLDKSGRAANTLLGGLETLSDAELDSDLTALLRKP